MENKCMPKHYVALPTMNELLEKTKLMSKQAQKLLRKKILRKDYRIKFAKRRIIEQSLQMRVKEKNQKTRMKVILHKGLKHTYKIF